MENNLIDLQSPFEQENKSNKIASFVPKYGLFTGLGMTISFMFFVITDLKYEQWTGYITSLFGFAIALIGVKQFRQEISPIGYLSFGQGFKTGFLIYLMGGIISMAFYFFYSSFIDPTFMDGLLEFTEEKMTTKGLSADQIKASMEFTKKIFQPHWMALMSLFFNLIFAAIFGLITGLVWKREQ
jgi:hypothetical protein